MKIMTTDQAAASAGLKVLVYGAPGVGKTVLCSTTGEPDRTVILSAEGGLISLRKHRIQTWVIESFEDMRTAYEQIRDAGKFTWVCLDSVSEIAEQCLVGEKRRTSDGRRAYGEMADSMFRLLRAFRDLPINVYFSCKLGAEQGQVGEEGRSGFGPLLPGRQLAEGVPYMFDLVFALRVAPDGEDKTKVTRWLMTQPDGRWTAKDRSGELSPWELPDLGAIARKIRASMPAIEKAVEPAPVGAEAAQVSVPPSNGRRPTEEQLEDYRQWVVALALNPAEVADRLHERYQVRDAALLTEAQMAECLKALEDAVPF